MKSKLRSGAAIQLQEWQSRKIKVYRVTVDERLTDNHVRLLICPLIAGIEDFASRETNEIVITDRDRNWDVEKEFIVTRENFYEMLSVIGLAMNNTRNFTWDDLREGGVFLIGNVKLVKTAVDTLDEKKLTTSARYIVDRKQFSVYRIDGIVKNAIKRLYFSVLKGVRHADRN